MRHAQGQTGAEGPDVRLDVVADGTMRSMRAWDAGFERECHALVETVCAGGAASTRDRGWQTLLTRVAPHIEAWAVASPALRRVGLTGEDEPRAVLVDVIDRLCERDFANLRAYLSRQPPDEEERSEAEMVEGLTRLAAAEPDESVDNEAPSAGGDALTGTPLRGWLVVLTRFVVKEHIKQRFGWRGVAHWAAAIEPASGAPPAWRDALLDVLRAQTGVTDVELDLASDRLDIAHRPAQVRAAELERLIVGHGATVRALPAPPGKRDVGSGAERLDGVPEIGERPPLSTLLGVRRALAEIHAYMAQFPAPMQRALTLWLGETGFDEIARTLDLAGAREAQALVRAGHARLRERFRGTWPELFG